MKTRMRLCGFVLAFAMMLSLFPTVAHAATEDSIPTKVRIFNSWGEDAIQIELADSTQAIDNIKTDSKNLFAMLTSSEKTSEQGEDVENPNNKNNYVIGLHSKKNGTYTLSFDIVDQNDKKVETKEIKIYSYDSPIKSVTLDGKNFDGYELSGKSAKVKITLTSGNTIKKLQYGVYQTKKDGDSIQSEVVYKTFKNGEKITFGTKPYYQLSEYKSGYEGYSYESEYMHTSMTCPTYIDITYYDKYTKRNETYSLYYSKSIE